MVHFFPEGRVGNHKEGRGEVTSLLLLDWHLSSGGGGRGGGSLVWQEDPGRNCLLGVKRVTRSCSI